MKFLLELLLEEGLDGEVRRLTTLRVPIRTEGGFWSSLTIWSMKFEVMPMMAMRETNCMARTTVKVAPRAPNCGPGMMAAEGRITRTGL